MATMKLFVWLGISIGMAFIAYELLPVTFPHVFHQMTEVPASAQSAAV